MTLFKKPGQFEKAFNDLELSSEIINGITFNQCIFLNCNLSEATLNNCTIKDCQFIHCNLSLIKLPQTYLINTEFKNCRMMGINWCQADWDIQSLLTKKHIDFEDCLLDHSLFIGIDLTETKFINSKAHQVDFEGANLSKANFSGTDLEGTRFVNCDLSKTNFTAATNYSINAGKNKLSQTRFSLPEAISLLHNLDIILEEVE